MPFTSGRLKRRSQFVVILGSVLFLGIVVPASGDPEDTGAPCAQSAQTVQLASELALSCGHDVEVLDERTEWTQTFATTQGTTRVEMAASAQRTRVDGDWAEIDTALEVRPDGVSVISPVYAMTFSDGSPGRPLAVIEKDGRSLEMGSPLPLTTPVISGDQVTYPEVVEGVDLVVSVHPDGTGFSQVLRVESPEAAANPLLAELDFPILVSQDLQLEAAGSGFEARDSEDVAVFTSPAPYMWDSSAESAAGMGGLLQRGMDPAASQPSDQGSDLASGGEVDRVVEPIEGDVVAPVPAELTPEGVVLTPDQELLTDEATTWPVYIDPGVSGSLIERAMVRSQQPNSAAGYGFSNQGVGYCNVAQDSACVASSYQRLMWEFNGLSAVAAASGSDVISAQFNVYGSHSWDCTPRGVQLWLVNAIDAGTTWNNHAISGWVQNLDTKSITHRSACSPADQKPRWVSFNATQALRLVADGDWSQVTFGLYVDESSMVNWKRYNGGDAGLSITYSRPPVTAGPAYSSTTPSVPCVEGDGRPYIRTTQPTLYWHANDPDGTSAYRNLDIVNVLWAWQWHWDAPEDQLNPYGWAHSATVPANYALWDGHTYRWSSGGKDIETGAYGPMTSCEFTVDVTAPSTVPGVSPVAGQPGVYGENAVGGGNGLQGQFDFSNGGVSDVASYNYSFDNDSMGWNAPASSPRVTFPSWLATPGTHRVVVQSVDRAGWTGPVKTYRFTVRPPVRQGWWRLDEGAGTTALTATVHPDLLPGGGTAASSLTLQGGTSWVDGPLAWLDPADKALSFASASQTAVGTGPVVDTSQSFSVMALVRMTSTTDFAAAVSQDGEAMSGFNLGVRTDSCGTANGRCFSFWMPDADTSSAASSKVLSSAPVLLDHWYHLTGVYNSSTDSLDLFVCDLGPDDEPVGLPQAVAATPTTGVVDRSWAAVGSFRLGRGLVAGSADYEWPGLIDEVQAFAGATNLTGANRACSAERS